MKWNTQNLSVLAVILHCMEQAARRGDVKALAGHTIVYQTIRANVFFMFISSCF